MGELAPTTKPETPIDAFERVLELNEARMDKEFLSTDNAPKFTSEDFGIPHERFPRVMKTGEEDTVKTKLQRAGRAVVRTWLYDRRGKKQ